MGICSSNGAGHYICIFERTVTEKMNDLRVDNKETDERVHRGLVSAILPVLSSEQGIGTAITSILEQTYEEWELLIIDGCAPKKEIWKKVRKYSQGDTRIHWIPAESISCIADLLNHGIREAKGDYIARISTDGVSSPNRFEKQVAFLTAHPEVGGCNAWQRCYGAEVWIQREVPDSTLMLRRELFSRDVSYALPMPLTDPGFLLSIRKRDTITTLPEILSIQRKTSLLKEKTLALIPPDVENEKTILTLFLEWVEVFQSMDEWNRQAFWMDEDRFCRILVEDFLMLCREISYLRGEVYEIYCHLFAKTKFRQGETFFDNVMAMLLPIGKVDQDESRIACVLEDFMGIHAGARIIIYGLGEAYRRMIGKWPADVLAKKYRVLGIMDAKAVSDEFSMITLEDLPHAAYDYILISSGKYFHDIKDRLISECHVPEEKIGMLDQIWCTMCE